MAIKEVIHVGDIGTKLRVTIEENDAPVDLTGATTLQILLKSEPDGTLKTFTATVEDAVNGIIYYTTASASDLDVHGLWKIEGRVQLAGGDWKTSIDTFMVYEVL